MPISANLVSDLPPVKTTQKSPNHRNIKVFAQTIGCMLFLLLSACSPPSGNQPSDKPFFVSTNKVILHKSHIISVKTSLYQPSFELQGVILPAKQQNITAPIAGTLLEIAVHAGQKVSKGDPLLTLAPIWHEGTKPKNTTLTAPFDGKIQAVYAKPRAHSSKGSVLLSLGSAHEFQFTSLLPSTYAEKLNIGQSVNFTLKNSTQTTATNKTPQMPDRAHDITGQIVGIKDTDDRQKAIIVHLHNDNGTLQDGMQLGGWVNYGDLTVGVLVPAHALVDGTNLTQLHTPPYKPSTPLPAHIWTINQDARLVLSDVNIIQYQPESNRYLIDGISQDSLIVSANLPMTSDNMTVELR